MEPIEFPETAFRCNGGGSCVIVEKTDGMFLISDSKNPNQEKLVFSRKEYAEFRRRVIDRSWPRLLLGLLTSALRYLAR